MLSPMRLQHSPLPLVLAYGMDELPELRRQSEDYAAARAGLPGRLLPLPGKDHFTILEELADADGALTAQVRLLAFYHLLPAPDGFLPRRLFAQGIDEARHGDWTMADDGSLYTLPIGSTQVHIGRIDE